MITKLLLGGAAALTLSTVALAQAAGGAGAAGASGGASAGSSVGTGSSLGPLGGPGTSSTTSGTSAAGVAAGVRPYQPAGSVNGAATGSAGIVDSAGSGSSLSNGINTTLEAGRLPSNDATVGGASAGGTTRVPNTSSCLAGQINCAAPAGPGSAPASSTGVGNTVGGTVGAPIGAGQGAGSGTLGR
jgi:hypothetical protein